MKTWRERWEASILYILTNAVLIDMIDIKYFWIIVNLVYATDYGK